jgi:hypothetical protein
MAAATHRGGGLCVPDADGALYLFPSGLFPSGLFPFRLRPFRR